MLRTKQERDEIAVAALEDISRAYGMSRAHSRLAAWAGRHYGDGDGRSISGVVREHFPPTIKTTLRLLARATGEHLERSYSRWRVAGRRRHTWLRAKEQAIARDGRGFYG